MLSSTTKLRDKLADNTEYFRKEMTNTGFNIKPGEHPIVPIMLGDAKLAQEVSEKMLKKNVFVISFSFPVVPKDQARIRVQLSAAHSRKQLDYTLRAFEKVGKELKLF